MALFGNRTQVIRLGVAFLCSVAVSAAALRADGTLKLTTTSTQFNPCNGEWVTGQVDVELMVQTNEKSDGTHVVVHRSFHGTLIGDQGNTYKVSSIANDQIDGLQPFFYDVPFENNVIGQGAAPDFTATGTVRVFVNPDQEPTGYTAFGLNYTCK